MMRRPSPAAVRWMLLAALFVFWELMPKTGLIPELFLPPLSKTAAVLAKDWREYASELSVTLYEVAFAMLIAMTCFTSSPSSVKTGIKALRRAWRKTTTRSLSPFADAVRT